MLRRIITSIILIPVLIYVVYADFLNSILLLCFVLALSYFGSKELYNLLKKVFGIKNSRFADLWSYIPGLALLVTCYINVFFKPNSAAILYIIAGYMALVFIGTFAGFGMKNSVKYLLVFGVCFIITSVFPLIIWVIRLEPQGYIFIYFLFFLGWLNDALAYFIGSFLGRTRGLIKYSPNKSLEGYIGSFVLTIMITAGLWLALRQRLQLSFIESVATGLLISVLAPLGDICESIVKRKAGVKDSSGFLPGLGGVLDVFDSILLSVPFYYLLLKIFAVI
jgi:phosphatidate cytidylyltransferase